MVITTGLNSRFVPKTSALVSVNYYEGSTTDVSMEWGSLCFCTITPVPSSVLGDSGAVVADSKGRNGVIITSGAGWMATKDITYSTEHQLCNEGHQSQIL